MGPGEGRPGAAGHGRMLRGFETVTREHGLPCDPEEKALLSSGCPPSTSLLKVLGWESICPSLLERLFGWVCSSQEHSNATRDREPFVC